MATMKLLLLAATATIITARSQVHSSLVIGAHNGTIDHTQIAGAWANNPDLVEIAGGSGDCSVLFPLDPNIDPNTLRCQVARVCNPLQAGGPITNNNDGYRIEVRNNEAYEDPNPPPSKRRHARELPAEIKCEVLKRQVDGDTGYTIVNQASAVVLTQFRKKIAGPLSATSEVNFGQYEEQTTGIETSLSVGAGPFDIFSVEASVSVSQDYTVGSSRDVNVVCPCTDPTQSCIVYWTPLFDVYQGFFTPSMTSVDFNIPRGDQASQEAYDTVCIG
ncbi:hypothetical protein Slin14017_G032300 [Septoria linicola]|nr:hypothetical protein Slin14017_G032300 [Septoria linicola]